LISSQLSSNSPPSVANLDGHSLTIDLCYFKKRLFLFSGPCSWPTTNDVSAAAVIFKTRRQQNGSDIDVFCDLVNDLNVANAPKSWKSIKKSMKLGVSGYCGCVQICNICGTKMNGTSGVACGTYNSSSPIPFDYYPINEQIQHLLLISDMYNRMKRQRQIHMENLRDILPMDEYCTQNQTRRSQ
jgi:hypothetical protein